MRRVVSLFLPNWPVDRLRRRLGADAPPPDRPLVLTGRVGRRRVVTACNAAAAASGARIGMAATQAQALIPDLDLRDADPNGDADALDRLAVWAMRRYAPVCQADPPGGLAIDITGAAHLKGGETALLGDLTARLQRVGVRARAAVAPTYGAAHAVARFRRDLDVVGEFAIDAALAPLPLEALRLPAELPAALRRMGFERIGDLAHRPRAPLQLRFGAELGRRLDQAYGRAAEPLIPVEAPETPRVEQVFAEPIGAPETLARYAGVLAAALCGLLEARGLGVRRLDWLCHRVDNRIEAVRVGLAGPVRDTRRLTRLLTDRIETIEPGFGIERMTLAASAAEPLDWRPAAGRLGEPAMPDVSGLIDTLSNRIGAERLYRLAPVESDVPERSMRKLAPLAAPTGKAWSPDWPRPARLFRRPEPIETLALLPDNPPTHFTWRGVRRRIRRADGPERIFGEWGRRDAEMWAVRDYFQVEDEAGERFWLFRAGDGEDAATGSQAWFIHGQFG
ncbi:MAG: nucleotidyltransferase [Brevundimonas sp.]|uniref:Y-family DNA polymerase n=1 Tax=Brevundimonas TaxID=41275 RepID=UPI000DB77177|nr:MULTISPECIES: DNA polymerase Y family protein [Brevundimonas]PZU72471.1 MAG: nucleotidyltransferase [Brevundimonas sp.]